MWIFKNYKDLTLKEHQELLDIRNEKEIREASNSKDIITLDKHLSWLKSTDGDYFALFIDDKIVGGVNYKLKDNAVTEWGIFFTKKNAPLISSLATYMFIEYLFSKSDILYSEVLKTNQKALKFNLYFGITILETTSDKYKLVLKKDVWADYKLNKLKSLTKRVDSLVTIFKEVNIK